MNESHENQTKGKDHDKEITIIVNGRPKRVPEKQMSFEEIAVLAFNPAPPNAYFTVTYSHGNQSGSLLPGQTLAITNGMIFNVTETNQS